MKHCNIIFRTFLFFLSVILFCSISIAQEEFPPKADPPLAEKLEIYSKLRDYRCANMPLDKCNCPAAKEMKAYIDALIEVGVGKEEIFYKVAKKFSLKTILDKQLKSDIEKRIIAESGEKRPQIVLEPNSFDFGEVSKKQVIISKVFKLANKGSETLIIKNIKPHCGCTTASLKVGKNKSPYFTTKGAPSDWQAQLKPGETADLDVVLDLNHSSVRIGKLIREIEIVSNDPLYPELTIRIEAEVK